MFSRMTVTMIVLALGIMCVPCQAIQVTNVTTGTVLFADRYEEPLTNGANSIPDTGAWYIERGSAMKVTDANSPGPYEGNQYGDSLGSETKDMAAFNSVQTSNGDLIRTRWASYFDTSSNAAERFVSHGLWAVNDGSEGGAGAVDNTVNLTMNAALHPDRIGYYDGTTADFAPQLNIIYDQWVEVTLDYAIGAATFTLTYGDQTRTGNARNPGNVGQFQAGHGNGTISYVDAIVPEPSAVALVLIGLLTLVGCRRRRMT